MLNHQGGTLEIAHESIFAEPPLPLLSSSTSIANPNHFHLDVITEFSKIWSNAHIFIVQEGTSVPITSLPTTYAHYVYYTASFGSVTFRIKPLPRSYMAALSTQPPSHRQGDQKQPMPFPMWFSHLLQVNDIRHLLPESDVQITYSHEQAPTYPPESAGTDWKFPASPTFSLSIVKSYLTESILNASETRRRLFFGIEDRLQCPIGHHIPNMPTDAFARECLAPEIFPSLRAEWFQLKLYEVSNSIPSNWKESIMVTTIKVKHLVASFVLSRGLAASVCPLSEDTHIQLLVPRPVYDELKDSTSEAIESAIQSSHSMSKEKLRSAWTSLRNSNWVALTSEPDPDIWNPRFVLEVELIDTHYCGAFFRTELGPLEDTNLLRLCFPFPHPHPPPVTTSRKPQLHPYTGLDPCAIWLRARAGVPFDVAVSELFFSPFFRKIIITDPTWDIEHSLRHYLLGRLLDNFEHLKSEQTSLASFRQLPLPTPYPRLIVASLPSLQAISEIVVSEEKSLWFILLFVDTNMQNCWQHVRKAVRILHPHSTVVDIRALVEKDDPFPLTSSVSHLESLSSSQTTTFTSIAPTPEPAITFDHIPTTTGKFVTSSRIDDVFKAWLLRKTPSEPPKWELLQAGRIYLSAQAQRLDKEISSAWSSQMPLQVVPIQKVFPASGATCMLRSVAFQQSKSATVLWVSRVNKYALAQNCTRDLDVSISSSLNRILVCTDELGEKKASKLLYALKRLTLARPHLRIIWLLLRAEPVSALSKSNRSAFVVSPFVEPSDIRPLANHLKVLGHEKSLDIVSHRALTSSRIEERHMFVFVLAATQGVCEPIKKWVGDIYKALSGFGERLLKVAISFAFVSAFAVDHSPQHQCIYDDPLDSIPPEHIQAKFDDAIAEFRKLFPSTTPSSPKSSTCLHPFLARLFLSNRFELYWENEYLDWKSLCDAWKLAVETLSRYERCDAILRTLLSERGRFAQFSPLIIEAWSSTSKYKPEQAVTEIQKYIVDILPDRIMRLHKHILLSRLYRCAAQPSSKPTPLLESAIKEAEIAQQQSKTTNNLGEIFTANQNAAVMHGVAYSINPQYFESSRGICDKILRQLYDSPESDDVQRDDLILMGRKWCSSDYWNQLQLSTENADPDEVDQLIVRGWNYSDAAHIRFGLFSERNVKKLTRTKTKRK